MDQHHPLVTTAVVLLAAGAFLVAYDVYLAWTAGYEATISYRTLRASQAHPVIPALVGFVVGLVFGHLFWSQ